MPKRNVTLTGTFTPNGDTKYKVEYYKEIMDDDTTFDVELDNVKYDKVANADITTDGGTTDQPVDVSKYKTHFDGYQYETITYQTSKTEAPTKEVLNIAGDGSLVIRVFYVRKSYTVSYRYTSVPEGKEVTPEPQPATYKYGASVTVAGKPELTGYTFNGWNAPVETTQEQQEKPGFAEWIKKLITGESTAVTVTTFPMPAFDVEFTGSFAINKYTITYNWTDKNGVAQKREFKEVEHFTEDYPIAENFDKPEAPSDSYFVEWKDDESGKVVTRADLEAKIVEGDASYTAQYNKKQDITLSAPVAAEKRTKVYDGKPLYASYEITDGSLKSGHEFDVVKYTVKSEDGTWTDNKLESEVYQTVTGTKTYNIDVDHVVIIDSKTKADVTEQYAIKQGNDADLEVTKRKITIVASSDSKTYDATPLTKAFYYIEDGSFAPQYDTEAGKVDEIELFKVYVEGSQTLPGSSDNIITSCEFDGTTADFSDNVNTVSFDNYEITRGKGTLTVERPESNIKMFLSVAADPSGANEKSRKYDGKYQSLDVDVVLTSKVSEGQNTDKIDLPEYEADGYVDKKSPALAQKEDKPSETKAMATSLFSMGVLTVYANDDPISIEPEVSENTELEDGNVKTITRTYKYGATEYTVSGIKLIAEGGVDVDDYRVYLDASEMKITLNGGNVTDLFDVEIVKPESSENGDGVVGILHVTQRDVVLTSETASKTYDGTALTRPVVKVTGDGFVEGEVTDLRATGSITEVGGPVANTISYKFDPKKGQKYIDDPELFTKNYVIETNTGSLSIVAAPADDDDDDDDTPSGGDTTTIPDAPVALAPSGAVLGAQRATGDGPAVLGARRAGTDDETNRMARVFAMVAAAAIAVTMLITGKKKDEEEEG